MQPNLGHAGPRLHPSSHPATKRIAHGAQEASLAFLRGSKDAVAIFSEIRTRTYCAIEKGWKSHWPFRHGYWFPERFRPLFRPFVRIAVEVEPQMRMLLHPEDYVSNEILNTGRWEPDTWAAIQPCLTAGGTFVDVGAHIGYFSLKAARVVGSQGRVIAVEPNPATLPVLRDNIRGSEAGCVEVKPIACSDAETELDLFAAARSNTGASSISCANALLAGSLGNVYRVPARPLDDILQEAGSPRVDVIKIDVEGAEMMVLRGARETLYRQSPLLIVEMLEHTLQALGSYTAEVTDFLCSLGYSYQKRVGLNNVYKK